MFFTLRRLVVLNLHFNEMNSLRIIFQSSTEVSDSDDTAMVFPPSSSSGILENSNILWIGPEELMESHGRTTYLLLFFKYSIEEEGLISSSPLRSILLSFEGTPLINLNSGLWHFLSR